ncbi:MAG: hypothetical protein JXR10_17350 [Cyclobacteriaceae bacterium]
MRNENIEQKVESTLTSLDHLSETDPGEFFAARTIQKMKNRSEVSQPISLVWKVAIAALIIFNIGSVVISNQNEDYVVEDAVSELSEDYFSSDLGINELDIVL